MDPTANLKEQREIIARYCRDGDLGDMDAYRLADLVEALDEWIATGGFLPEQWEGRCLR